MRRALVSLFFVTAVSVVFHPAMTKAAVVESEPDTGKTPAVPAKLVYFMGSFGNWEKGAAPIHSRLVTGFRIIDRAAGVVTDEAILLTSDGKRGTQTQTMNCRTGVWRNKFVSEDGSSPSYDKSNKVTCVGPDGHWTQMIYEDKQAQFQA